MITKVINEESPGELPGMPPRSIPREGSNAWKLAEFRKFQVLSKKHEGLTTPFFAKIALSVSRERIYQLIETGHLPTVEVMGKNFIPCDELQRFAAIERRTGRPRHIAELAT